LSVSGSTLLSSAEFQAKAPPSLCGLMYPEKFKWTVRAHQWKMVKRKKKTNKKQLNTGGTIAAENGKKHQAQKTPF